MMTISAEQELFTVMTILSIKPTDQEKFLEAFKLSLQWMRKEPGFVAAALHKSLDGTTIINYLQWRSQADFDSYVNSRSRAKREKEAQEFITAQGYGPPDRRPYKVVFLALPEAPEEEGAPAPRR
jgi:heme-degrading monooxygenase HmoA